MLKFFILIFFSFFFCLRDTVPVVCGALSGALYKLPGGPRAMGIAALLGAGIVTYVLIDAPLFFCLFIFFSEHFNDRNEFTSY